MLDLIKKIANLKILQRATVIKMIKEEHGEAFGRYINNRALALIISKHKPNDHYNLMVNRAQYRRDYYSHDVSD